MEMLGKSVNTTWVVLNFSKSKFNQPHVSQMSYHYTTIFFYQFFVLTFHWPRNFTFLMSLLSIVPLLEQHASRNG